MRTFGNGRLRPLHVTMVDYYGLNDEEEPGWCRHFYEVASVLCLLLSYVCIGFFICFLLAIGFSIFMCLITKREFLCDHWRNITTV